MTSISLAAQSVHITDIEAAINFWRDREPAREAFKLSDKVRVLAHIYAKMVFMHQMWVDAAIWPQEALQAWLSWYETTVDTPCIAICSTTQGDSVCKGCGRTFDEVQFWTAMSAFEKRQVWVRITQHQTALRFTTYTERSSPVSKGVGDGS